MNDSRRLVVIRTAAVLVVLVLLVVIAVEITHLRRHQRLESLRHDAIDVASAQVVDLTTVDAAHIDRRIASMRRRTTGDFRRQLQGMTQTFTSVVRNGKVRTSGDVVAAAVTSVTERKASVLIANRTTVTNKSATKPATRAYRIRVDLARVGGVWLVSGMEFVQ